MKKNYIQYYKLKIIFFLTFLLIQTNIHLFSQGGSYNPPDGRTAGLAGTGNALPGIGLWTWQRNPGFLHYIDSAHTKLSIKIPAFSGQALTNSLSMEDINFYFAKNAGKGKILSDKDKANLVDAFSGDGKMFLNTEIEYFSIAFMPDSNTGTFAFSFKDIFAGSAVLPQSLVDLVLNGNDSGKIYSFNDFELQSWYLRCYSFGYARKISMKIGSLKNLRVGITVKYIQGFAYANSKVTDSYIYTGAYNKLTGDLTAVTKASFSPNLNVNYDFDSTSTGQSGKSYSFFSSDPAGTGYGFDLGFATDIGAGFHFGMSLTNIGVLDWTNQPAQMVTKANFAVDDLIDKKQLDSLLNSMSTSGTFIDNINTGLPTALRIGLSCEIHKYIENFAGSLIVAMDIDEGFDNLPTNSTSPRISFGAMYYPGSYFPTFSLGVGVDQVGKTRFAAGLGYETKIVDFFAGTTDVITLFGGNNAMHFSAAVTALWKIY
ncbi:MAG: hypothetical protein HW421_3883 [Ignavibacteria bacterium]|nr:hypothetical protein [Ignavibacteria bacterium]